MNQERWDKHFLDHAVLCARMSKDPSTTVGAVVVGPDREVRATGFNGFPRGISDDNRLLDREQKLQLVVHAECNTICNAARVGVSLKGCTIYIAASDKTGQVWGGPPCTRCSVHVIQAGIERVVTYPFKAVPSRWADDLEVAKAILREAMIEYIEVPA